MCTKTYRSYLLDDAIGSAAIEEMNFQEWSMSATMFPDRVIHLQPWNMKSQDVMWKDGEPEKRQLPEKLIMRITYGQLSMACKHMAKKNYKE